MIVNGKTDVFGILGNPVEHSLSPAMHNAAFQKIGYNAIYTAFPTQKISKNTLSECANIGLKALSVTIPYKTDVYRYSDRADPLSQLCRASNTILFGNQSSAIQHQEAANAREKSGMPPASRKDNLLIEAFNTDGPGAMKALQEFRQQTDGLRYLVIGYGGSAAALAHSIAFEKPESLMITGRDKAKRKKFLGQLKRSHPELDRTNWIECDITAVDPEKIDIIIQTTPLGMKGQGMPVPESFLMKHHTVFDIVYVPEVTPLLAAARKARAQIVPGYLMLLYQGVLQFELFTGLAAPIPAMKNVLLKELRKRKI